MNNLIFFFMIFSGIYSFISWRKHIFMSLMSLEFLVVFFFLGFVFVMGSGLNMFVSLVYLTYSACEGALGLSIIVSLVRGSGNDLFSSSGLIQC
uniref:NADH-ubiquinone oxidoreductase chain 4L n=1 Tax=Scutigerella causeyae TaxID=388540 RepID=Q06RF7_9MYRI|nr:NADH dehydrogenase subunit 4L [Scutigerella causeyae]ABF93310.1 NADH dehydrogenase subunit 4L [Scutigerella causeyae]